MCDISERDLYWLAGLLEGEASFHLQNIREGKHVYPVIKLKMCDRDVVEKANRLLGGTSRVLEWAPQSDRHKPAYTILVIGSKAIPWLRRLRPLMGQRRHQQIDDVLAGMTAIDLHHKHCVKLDSAKVEEIRALWQARAMTQIEMAALYGVTKWTINSVITGRTWRDKEC